MQVLIIEDDVEAANSLATGLRESGYGAQCAHNGRDGLAAAQNGNNFDMLIVDRMLPEMDGLEVISRLLCFTQLGAHLRHVIEIGRASCRERV